MELCRKLTRLLRRQVLALLVASRPEMRIGSQSTVVIAPHPDDEVFGAAGLIQKKIEAGARLKLIYLTSGEAAHQSCCAANSRQVGKAREALARQVTQAAGISPENCIFLRFADSRLPAKDEPEYAAMVERLAKELQAFEPAEVFVTHPGEVWHDHCAAYAMARDACTQLKAPVALWSYFVWTGLSQKTFKIALYPWENARRLSLGKCLVLKQKWVQIYGEIAQTCPHRTPWIGLLPEDFYKLHEAKREVFFAENRTGTGYSA